MKLIDTLKRRHARLDHELAAERARRMPDPARVARLKKLKLAVKDRLALLRQREARRPLAPTPA
jgi:hypothetical protein